VSTRTIDAKMGGSGSFEIVVDTGRENGLHEPAFMLALEQLHGSVPRIPLERAGVRKTLSLADILKEIHQALNENRSDHYAIPEDRQLIAQELLLFENSGSDDLEDFVDSRFSKARFTARVPWAPGRYYEEFLANLEDLAQATFPEAKVQVTGMTSLIVVAAERLRRGMMRSYGLALMIITPLMMLLIGSLRGGLASMIPNLAPILCVMGGMGLVGIKLDVFTMLIGSIAIGLAVDDTIHFMHGFYRRFAETGDTRGSVRDTLATTGNALLTTSIVLSTGFIVFAFASMWNLVLFGVLTSLAIALAFLADVIVAPALVTLATRGKKPPGIALQQERLHEAS
jgi:predicted RND superfamily exporter protein